MATVVVSGRVDEAVRDRAAVFIRAAGLTAGEIIKNVWDSIARTGEVPGAAIGVEHFERDPWNSLMEIRSARPKVNSEYEWLKGASTSELMTFIAEGRLHDHKGF